MPKRAKRISVTIARRIRLLGLDVDGVLTDGGVYIGRVGDHAVELKRFSMQDGLGLVLLRMARVQVVVVSGDESEATAIRARELEVDELIQDDRARKLPAFEELLQRRGVRWDECAFVGDDLADLPLLRRVALPVAVANAVPEVRSAAQLITRATGGQGAVREFVEVLLRTRGEWHECLERYLHERGDVAPPSTRSR